MKSKILHIHSDYPDGREGYPFTKAVSNLVSAADVFDHYVVSIKRTSNIFKVSTKTFNEGISCVYWCIPVPGLYHFMLWAFCLYLNFRLRKLNFDIIHGHKLTLDGVVANYIATKRAKPYCLSIRGGTDLGYIRRFPGLKTKFAKVLSAAECVFWLAPWTKKQLCSTLEASPKREANLPNFCQIPSNKNAQLSNNNKLFIVASYSQYKRKAVLEVIESVRHLKQKGVDVSLDIFGSGDEQVKQAIQGKIRELELEDRVFIKGQVQHAELIECMYEYSALVLPSVNETFGMVFVESLAAKVPFVAHSNSGVDGYFDGDYAVFLENQQPDSIAQAVENILSNRGEVMNALNQLHDSGEFFKFTKEGVIKDYTSKINGVLAAPQAV